MSTETEKYEKEMETCTLDAVITKLEELRKQYGGKGFCIYDAVEYGGITTSYELHADGIYYEGGKIHF